MQQKITDTFSTRSLNSLRGIHPYLVAVIVATLKASPIDFTITDGSRTTEEQQALHAKGRTEHGKVVTNADGVKNKSNHQLKNDGWAYSVDLYPFINGKVQLNDIAALKRIAAVFKQKSKELNIKTQWGGDWRSFKDYPHFELIEKP